MRLLAPGFFALLMLLTGSNLQAAPLLHVWSSDLEHFPQVSLRVGLSALYDERGEGVEWGIIEPSRDGETHPVVLSAEDILGQARRVNLLILMDSTRSLSSDDFSSIQKDTASIIDSLEGDDSAALYTLNSKATLRMGFNQDRQLLKELVQSIVRDGDSTRVYDSLFTVIQAGRDASLFIPEGRVEERSAVILLTDGRDEGSFITDNDCAELTELGSRLHIPVHVLHYGSLNNSDQFKRLATRTGGMYLPNPNQKSISHLAEDFRRLREKVIRVVYRSELSKIDWIYPGRVVKGTITWRTALASDHSPFEYEITWLAWFQSLTSSRPLYLLITLGSLLFFLLLIFLLFYLGARSRKRSRKPPMNPIRAAHSARAASGRDDVISTLPGVSDSYQQRRHHFEESKFERVVIPPGESIRQRVDINTLHDPDHVQLEEETDELDDIEPIFEDSEEYIVEESLPQQIAPAISDPPSVTSGASTVPSRSDYIKDYSRRLLNNALREGTPYSRASLRMVDPAGKLVREYELVSDQTVIGSDRWASIRLRDDTVSPIHVRIKQFQGKFILYDMVSGTGSYLNRKKVLRPRALHDGDELKVGRTRLLFFGES